jgi:GntR family transcriptional regulator/MocR family aminotransferase
MGIRQANQAEDDGFPGDLLVPIERVNRRDLAVQLENGLRRAIRDGRMKAGTSLPASRVLARELGVSRSVVVGAYGQLAAEGYLEARRGAGTRVRTSGGPAADGDDGQTSRQDPNRQLLAGLPDPASFPRGRWQHHYRAVLGELPDVAFGYQNAQGASELRSAMAEYLGRVRGVATNPDRILICGGFAQGLALTCRTLKARGARRVAIEDPCFGYHRDLIAHAGLEPVPVPVDEHGIDTQQLPPLAVDAVLVSPAHSCPTGAVLSPERRLALVDWAHQANTVIIEDDYDAEFRYDRAPIGALQGLAPERVIYGGSVSKTLSPSLRVGWLVLPTGLTEEVRREKFFDDMATSTLDQLVLARFIAHGDLARHLRHMRPIYRKRRDATLKAIATQLPGTTACGVDAGLHVFLELPQHCDEKALVQAARRLGVHVQGAARAWADPDSAPPALVLGFGAASEPAITHAIKALGTAYSSQLKRQP